ncbi:MAG: DNA-deoxyinosine glycosylase [Clostridium sp.]|nr:DNA-deoxyinosine glycosylase [Clostridium sp.]
MAKEIIESFPPIINKESKLLILGSMPGAESLKTRRYYAFERNQFWRLIFDILEGNYTFDYEKRKNFLLDNNLGLYSVIKSCTREGSLDSNIKNEEINNFKELFIEYKNIETICFNGNKSHDSFIKNVDKNIYMGKKLVKLPSTSPAYTISYEKKFIEWKKIKDIVEKG